MGLDVSWQSHLMVTTALDCKIILTFKDIPHRHTRKCTQTKIKQERTLLPHGTICDICTLESKTRDTDIIFYSVVEQPHDNGGVWPAVVPFPGVLFCCWKSCWGPSHSPLRTFTLMSSHSPPQWSPVDSLGQHRISTTASTVMKGPNSVYSTLDSVKVFDLLAKNELTSNRFNQGGTAVLWAPSSVSLNTYHMTTGKDCHCQFSENDNKWIWFLGGSQWRLAGDRLWGWGGPTAGTVRSSEAVHRHWLQSHRTGHASSQTGVQTPQRPCNCCRIWAKWKHLSYRGKKELRKSAFFSSF